MLCRDISELLPDMQTKINDLIHILMTSGIGYYINETYREQAVQDAYYAQGREDLNTTNSLRKKAGLWLIGDSENKRIITKTKHSKHTDRVAVDIYPTKNGVPYWTAPDKEFETIASIALKLDLNPGLYWKDFKDPPHIQLK